LKNWNLQSYLDFRRHSIVFFKYVLATATSLYIASRVAPTDLLSCGFVAVLTLQPNLYRGLVFSWQQIKATTLAALITTAVVFALGIDVGIGVSLLAASISMGFTIVSCMKLKMEESTVVGLFTVIYLMVLPQVVGESYLGMLHLRYLTILIGIGTATVFNFLSSLFRYQDRLHLNLIENTKALASRLTAVGQLLGGGDVDNEKLEEQLNNFGSVFERLRATKQDLNEIEKELILLKNFPRELKEKENYLQRGMLYTLNDISHYSWDIILNLRDLEHKGEIVGKSKETLNLVSGQLEKLTGELKELNLPSSGVFKKEHQRRLDRLYSMLEEYSRQGGEEALTFVTLLSDLVHLELTTVHFNNLVTRYVESHKKYTKASGQD
jgi:uncharacterized membrane protein YgaE (UPF0421/DUF939 family)